MEKTNGSHMEINCYRYDPNFIPQPYFIPGYTGFIPKFRFNLGQSYGQSNYKLIQKDPSLAARLSLVTYNESSYKPNKPIMPKIAGDIPTCIEDDMNVSMPEHVCSGYGGFLPKICKKRGIPMNPCCRTVLEEFKVMEPEFGRPSCHGPWVSKMGRSVESCSDFQDPYDTDLKMMCEDNIPYTDLTNFDVSLKDLALRRKDGMVWRYPESVGVTRARHFWF